MSEAFPSHHPATAWVNLDRIRENFKALRSHAGARAVIPVLKANAYGHGAVEVARALDPLGVAMFAVAYVDEGIALRQAGIRTPILVMAGFAPGQVPSLLKFDLTPVISTGEQVGALAALPRDEDRAPMRVHVKVDTGMSRLGFRIPEIEPAIHRLEDAEGVRIEGLMTHLASADEDEIATARQLDLFDEAIMRLETLGVRPSLIHAANSAGMAFTRGTHTAVRPGLLLYGVAPRPLSPVIAVQPAMELRARVALVKRVRAGTPVSYGGRFVAGRDTLIATINAGYADGIPRTDLMRTKGALRHGETALPVTGTVCMDLTMLDATEAPNLRSGDEVTVFGDAPHAWDVAGWAGTNAWQILTGVGPRVPRRYTGVGHELLAGWVVVGGGCFVALRNGLAPRNDVRGIRDAARAGWWGAAGPGVGGIIVSLKRMLQPSRLLRPGLVGALAVLLQACTEAIVTDGQAGASIIVPISAPVEVMRAAKELQAYVLKTSGAELAIRTDDAPRTERVEIRLAVTPLGIVAGGDPASQLVHEDGYTIQSSGRMITIMGGSPRGTLYGVYDFVERVLGVRWFMPTDLGEDILPAKTIPVPELEVVKNPAFPSVSGFTWAGGPGAEDWELRSRVRVGKGGGFGHNWYNIHRYSKETFEKNPEMFAMVGGKRGYSTQLCTANPEVIKVSAEAARRYFKANPEAPLFSISPNDGNGWCECDRCRRIDELYDITDGSLADRFVHYANEVLAELEKTYPDKRVGILAYVEHTAPPRRAKPRPNYETLLTRQPWAFCHVHAIDDPSCPANREFLSYLKGWQALTKHVGVYDYYGHFFAFTPWPIVHSIRRDIPLFKKLGVERFISETQQNWANQGVNFYVAAKLVEDPGRDVDALLGEYFWRFYGKARDPMRRYFDLWEDAMRQTSAAGDRGYAWLSMFTPALVSDAGLLLKQAEALAQSDTEKVQARVALARSGFGYTEAYAQMLDAAGRNDRAAVLKWSEEAQKRVKATEGSAPQAFFVSLAIDQTRYLASNILARGVMPWVALKPIPFPSATPTPPTTP